MKKIVCPCGKEIEVGPKLAKHRAKCEAFQVRKYGVANQKEKEKGK